MFKKREGSPLPLAKQEPGTIRFKKPRVNEPGASRPLILILPLILIPHPAQPEPLRTSAALGGLFFNRRGRRETQRCPAGVCAVFEEGAAHRASVFPQQSEL